ncbi:putative gonadotropin-releasing hormone II receptor [Xyrichtys novacula]|uniref:Gonadotropin-releasing hormone II receptor n=1 Tax=Xyrichtys novacula TaxID=13765 RepID=A0AAV1EID8_XYRNO|nr:putative gonadotropin-releasing hormone II receptor [Xyrichtys novacula]
MIKPALLISFIKSVVENCEDIFSCLCPPQLFFLSPVSSNEPHLRCSKNNIPKARMRTLKMSIVIVICFIGCWTPYYLLGLWYWFFPDDIEGKVSHSLTHILFIFGLFNTCLDPVIYGLFTVRFRKSCNSKAPVRSDLQTNSVVIESLKCTQTALHAKKEVTAAGKDSICAET